MSQPCSARLLSTSEIPFTFRASPSLTIQIPSFDPCGNSDHYPHVTVLIVFQGSDYCETNSSVPAVCRGSGGKQWLITAAIAGHLINAAH